MIYRSAILNEPLSTTQSQMHKPSPAQGVFAQGWIKAAWMTTKSMCVRSSGRSAQKGSLSRGSSPGSAYIPKSVVGTYELDRVPLDWDNDHVIRDRIREGLNLCVAHDFEKNGPVSKYVDATVENLKLNAPVLLPLARLMGKNELQLPAIEKLINAVTEFFLLAKISKTSDHSYQEAWALRRMIGKLKRFTYRSWPPQDPQWWDL